MTDRHFTTGSWNYRVVRYKNGSGYGLHECYYNAEGKLYGMNGNPAEFVTDDPAGVTAALTTALNDARNRDVLDEPDEHWPGDPEKPDFSEVPPP